MEDSENGQVEASRTSASRGSSVTLTATPDEGYELSSLTVTDADGNEIEVTENDGIYRFTMPSSKVTLSLIHIYPIRGRFCLFMTGFRMRR